MSALTQRQRESAHVRGVNAATTLRVVETLGSAQVARPETAFSFAASLWQEAALARITAGNKGGLAHMAIGQLVTKLHLGVIDCGIAESVFVGLLNMESEK